MKAKSFSDVCIVPGMGSASSRSSIDLSTAFGKFSWRLPVMVANMPAVSNPQIAQEVHAYGGSCALHRWNTIDEAKTDYTLSGSKSAVVSIGVKDKDKKRFEELYERGARVFCIDVSHGHHQNVKDMLKWINREAFPWDKESRSEIVLIAGNIATTAATYDLGVWGADAVKVGIGPGSACTTRLDTGVGVPQFTAIQAAHSATMNQKIPVKIIADGGCSNVGDIAKALGAGADMVMLGKMFAGTDESPGEFIVVNGKEMKVYYGSASLHHKKVHKNIEGRSFLVERKGKVVKILEKIEDGLQSAFSFVGANSLSEYHSKCTFQDISEGGKAESKLV
jgi:IMP dehydrogenase/GMP reductase